MEEKVKRLGELSDFAIDMYPEKKNREDFMRTWLEEAIDDTFLDIESTTVCPERAKHVQKTWDVHTGAAFTPLYKALK